MAVRLTRQQLDKMDAGSKPVTDAHVQGLRYVPSRTAKGAGKWVLRYRDAAGKRHDVGLGGYTAADRPGNVTPAVARENAAKYIAKLVAGEDPLAAKAEAKAKAEAEAAAKAAADTLTFEKVARKVHELEARRFKSEKHKAQWIGTLEAYAFPTLGAKHVAEITKADVIACVQDLWFSKPDTAQRTLQRIRRVLDWAEAHDHIASNPAVSAAKVLTRPARGAKAHHPAMPHKAVGPWVQEHLTISEPVDVTKAAVLWTILTAARAGETLGATWDELDLEAGVWTVPAARMKMDRPHRVPLSPQAVFLARRLKAAELHPKWVFPGRGNRPVRVRTLGAFMERMAAPSDVPGKAACLHGMRSSYRDWCSETGVSRELAERALAHVVRGVEGAYARSDLLEQRRPVMEKWADHVAGPALALVAPSAAG